MSIEDVIIFTFVLVVLCVLLGCVFLLWLNLRHRQDVERGFIEEDEQRVEDEFLSGSDKERVTKVVNYGGSAIVEVSGLKGRASTKKRESKKVVYKFRAV